MAPTTALEKIKASEDKLSAAQAKDVKIPEITTTIGEMKSPWSCPVCAQKKLIYLHTDNWIQPKRFLINPTPSLKRKPREELITTHHCLGCNFGLTENEDHREMRERNDKNQSDGDQPWATSAFFLILMLGSIFMITVFRSEPQRPSLVETGEQLELSTRR